MRIDLSMFLYGTSSEIRTHDQRIKSPLRYRCAMLAFLAGDAGLEPTHAGIKIQCLTNLANPLQFTESRIFKERARSIHHA